MAKTNQQNAPAGTEHSHDGAGVNLEDFSEKENLGFPAYWKAKVGAKFAARVMSLNDSDPDFQRWIFQATRHPVTCARGPAESAKEVVVPIGDFFSTSAYAQFGNNESGRGLHQFIGEEILLECTGIQKTDQPTPMFVYEVHVTKETRARLLAKRQERIDGAFAAKGQGAPVTATTRTATA